jgi:hypothetical protein
MNRTARPTRALGRSRRRLFGGYGPLLALAVAFLLVVTLVPTIAREEIVAAAQSVDPAARVSTTSPVAVSKAAPRAVASRRTTASGVPASRRKTALGAAADTAVAVPGAADAPGPAGGLRAVTGSQGSAVGPCARGAAQVLGDPYYPP